MSLRFCVLIPIPIHIILEEERKIKNIRLWSYDSRLIYLLR